MFVIISVCSVIITGLLLILSGRGGGRIPRNQNKSTPTAEELDAELDAYTKEMK